MMSSSLSGASRTDSTSESWLQSYAKNQSVDPAAAGGGVLFESLFTAEFFQSAISNKATKGTEPIADKSSSESAVSEDDSESEVTSDTQINRETTKDYDKLVFGGPHISDQKGNQPIALIKKKDDKKDGKKDSKEQDKPTAIVPYCPPPVLNPANTGQSKDTSQNAANTKTPDGDKIATNQLPSGNVKAGPTEQDAGIGLQDSTAALGSLVSTNQSTAVQPAAAQTNKDELAAKESQKTNTNADASASAKNSIPKSEQPVNQPTSGEHTNKIRPQQTEQADSQQDNGEGDKPQNRRAERLEESRIGQKDAPVNSDTSAQTSEATDRSQVQDQSQPENLVTQATASSPSADVTLAASLSTMSSSDTATATATLTDIASTAAANAVATLSAGSASLANSTQVNASATSAVAATTEVNASPLSGASAVAQPAAPLKTVSSDSSPTASQGSTPVSTEPLTEYQQSRLLQRVLKGLERLDDQSSVVRLRLHPPELGALEMSLHVSQQQLSATINVDSEATRQVLQDNLPQLQSKLAERGIAIEKFDVQVQSTSSTNNQDGSFNQQQPGFSSGGSWNGESGQGRGFGEARWNQIRPQAVESSDATQTSSHVSRYYSGQNLNLHA